MSDMPGPITGFELFYGEEDEEVGGGNCSGGGEITVVADPTGGETFTGRSVRPRAWMAIGMDDMDRAFARDSYNHPSTYYGGRKTGNIKQIGAITRRLSDRFSSYKMADVTIEIDDTSRLFSTLEASAVSQYWANREARIHLASPETIAAGGTPHTLFRGIWRGHKSSGRNRTITFTDILGSEFSDFNVEATVPSRLITTDDFPDCPKENRKKVVPIGYGKWSDRNLQTVEIGTTLPYDPSLPSIRTVGCRDIAPPPGDIEGSISVYVCGVKDGFQGPISNMAGTTHHDPHSTEIGWDQDPFFDSYVIYVYDSPWWLDWTPQGGVKAGAKVTRVRMLTHDNTTFDGGSGSMKKDMSVFFEHWTDGVDVLSGVSTAQVDQGKGPVSPPYTGIRTIGGVQYHEWVLCGHAIQHVEDIYINDVAQNIQTNASIAGSGAPWLIPGYAGWTDVFGSTTVRVINGHTYTLLYGKVGQRGPDTAAGTFTETSETGNTKLDEDVVRFGVAFCGVEDVGDSSGNTITSAPRIAFHLLNQWVLDQYETGLWSLPAESADGIPWLNSASFVAMENIEVQRVGGGGYQGAVYLDQPISVRTLLARMLVSWDMYFGQNEFGQVIGVHLDDFADLSNLHVITDVRNIVEDTDIDRKIDELENRVVYDFSYRPAANEFDEKDVTIEDAQAIEDNRGRAATGERRQMYYTRDSVTALDVASRALAIGKYPPRYVEITCTLHEVSVKLGQLIQVTDMDGIGASGWADRRLWVIGIQVILDSLDDDPVVKLTCMDVERFYSSVGVMGDRTTLLSWTAESDANRAAYLFLADRTTGRFSDGEPAKGLR